MASDVPRVPKSVIVPLEYKAAWPVLLANSWPMICPLELMAEGMNNPRGVGVIGAACVPAAAAAQATAMRPNAANLRVLGIFRSFLLNRGLH